MSSICNSINFWFWYKSKWKIMFLGVWIDLWFLCICFVNFKGEKKSLSEFFKILDFPLYSFVECYEVIYFVMRMLLIINIWPPCSIMFSFSINYVTSMLFLFSAKVFNNSCQIFFFLKKKRSCKRRFFSESVDRVRSNYKAAPFSSSYYGIIVGYFMWDIAHLTL
jgi:hypothetical protein